MTTTERVERIRNEQAKRRAGVDQEWLARQTGRAATSTSQRCQLCGDYGTNCRIPGVYLDTGLCHDCEEEVLALAVVVREARGESEAKL